MKKHMKDYAIYRGIVGQCVMVHAYLEYNNLSQFSNLSAQYTL